MTEAERLLVFNNDQIEIFKVLNNEGADMPGVSYLVGLGSLYFQSMPLDSDYRIGLAEAAMDKGAAVLWCCRKNGGAIQCYQDKVYAMRIIDERISAYVSRGKTIRQAVAKALIEEV